MQEGRTELPMETVVAIDARLMTQNMTGDTSYWRGLVTGLASLESDLRFLLMSNTEQPAGIPASDKFQWINVPARSSRWWSLVTFPLGARRRGARVLHTQYNVSPLAGRCAVTTIHDVSFFIGPNWFSPRDRFLLRWQVPASVKRASRVITVSETSRKEIEQFIPASKGKVRVTPNALGENIRPMPQADAEASVKNLGVETPYVLTVGTRWPRKNMPLAVRSAQAAGQRLVVTGKQGWGEELSDAVYTGYVDDHSLTALYQCADLYLAPSFHEGFGIPLLEAFACGCPVLCSPGGALPEVSGGAAEIAPDFEVQTWADRIRSLLADSSKLDAMRQRGFARVKDFSWEKTAQLTCQAYLEAART